MDRVAVIVMARAVAEYIPLMFRGMERWTREPRRVFVLANDCPDSEGAAFRAAWEPSWNALTRVQYLTTGVPLFPRVATAERAAHLARVRNHAIEWALGFEWEWGLIFDTQKHLPKAGLAKLLARNVDIVAPLSLYPRVGFYDVWCTHHLDGSRFKHNDWTGPELEEVASVGGTVLVKRAVFDAGCRYGGTDGTDCDSVPFCGQARERGFKVYLDRSVISTCCLDVGAYRALVEAEA